MAASSASSSSPRAEHLTGGTPALGLHLLGGLAQGHLAQRGQVLYPKEVVQRRRNPLGGIDLALAQAGDQRLGSEIHEHDLVGRREHAVGEGLAHPHPGQLGHAVVERLQVLDVDGGEHVDTGVEHVVDVLVALAVLEPRRVGMGQLVDQAQLWSALEDRGQVHLVDLGAAVLDLSARQALQALRLCLGLGARVRLEVADYNVKPGGALGLALLEHAVGLADTGGHAQEDLVLASHRYAPSTLWTTKSISLMPTKGAITPPTP